MVGKDCCEVNKREGVGETSSGEQSKETEKDSQRQRVASSAVGDKKERKTGGRVLQWMEMLWMSVPAQRSTGIRLKAARLGMIRTGPRNGSKTVPESF